MIEIIALATLLQPAPPPYAGEWTVEIIDNIKVMPESRVTISIDGTAISGQASCNTYRGTFTPARDNRIKIGQLLRTMKSCDPARMSEEQDFLGVLGSVTEYEVRSDGTLVLRTAAGKTVTARRVGATVIRR